MNIFSDSLYQCWIVDSFPSSSLNLEEETITYCPNPSIPYSHPIFSPHAIGSLLFFHQSPALLAVSQKMQQLFNELRDPLSETAKKLAKEMHDKRHINNDFSLRVNISYLNNKLQNENDRLSYSLLRFSLILNIINVFRQLFNYSPLSPKKHFTHSYKEWNTVLDGIQKANAPFSIQGRHNGICYQEFYKETFIQLQYEISNLNFEV